MKTLITLDELSKSNEFHIGLTMGINICQRMILNANERNEPLMVDKRQFYILDGEQLLNQMIDTVCDG